MAYPDRWRGTAADYEMDPEITQSETYASRMQDAMLALPTLSVQSPWTKKIFSERQDCIPILLPQTKNWPVLN
ncbi:MAG: hypothetical protein R3C28_05750 [Pirellulaceae bacterium]